MASEQAGWHSATRSGQSVKVHSDTGFDSLALRDMQGACWPWRAGCVIIQPPYRCRNFLIDSTQDEAEHPAIFPGSEVYFLVALPGRYT